MGLKSPVAKPRPPGAPVTLQGWLLKQGSDGLMLWKRRWFVLSEYCLYYYKDTEEKDILGSILLPSYRISPVGPDEKVFRKFAFKAEHANMRTYVFAADNHEVMVHWMNALSLAAILQTTPKNQAQQRNLRNITPKSGTPASRIPDESDSGFHGSSSTRSLHHQGHLGRLSSESLLDDSGPQPLYVNAPPKPRRLNNSIEESPDMAFVPIQVPKQPPRPHSADFLEAEMPSKPSRPSLNRPKSSLEKVDYNQYWAEEGYAQQMRNIVKYKNAYTPPVQSEEVALDFRYGPGMVSNFVPGYSQGTSNNSPWYVTEAGIGDNPVGNTLSRKVLPVEKRHDNHRYRDSEDIESSNRSACRNPPFDMRHKATYLDRSHHVNDHFNVKDVTDHNPSSKSDSAHVIKNLGARQRRNMTPTMRKECCAAKVCEVPSVSANESNFPTPSGRYDNRTLNLNFYDQNFPSAYGNQVFTMYNHVEDNPHGYDTKHPKMLPAEGERKAPLGYLSDRVTPVNYEVKDDTRWKNKQEAAPSNNGNSVFTDGLYPRTNSDTNYQHSSVRTPVSFGAEFEIPKYQTNDRYSGNFSKCDFQDSNLVGSQKKSTDESQRESDLKSAKNKSLNYITVDKSNAASNSRDNFNSSENGKKLPTSSVQDFLQQFTSNDVIDDNNENQALNNTSAYHYSYNPHYSYETTSNDSARDSGADNAHSGAQYGESYLDLSVTSANNILNEYERNTLLKEYSGPLKDSSRTKELKRLDQNAELLFEKKKSLEAQTLPTLAKTEEISLDIKKSSLWASYINPVESLAAILSTSHDNLVDASKKEEEVGFIRSKSARLPSKKNDVDSTNSKEESMTRLLEWKQRMLQSPLTKKQNGRSSDTSSPLSHTSTTLKNRSKSNLTAVNVATLSADFDGGSVRSHSSRGRKSRPATPSSDEDVERNRPVRRRSRRSNSSGKSRRSNDSTKSSNSVQPTSSTQVQSISPNVTIDSSPPDYENVYYSRTANRKKSERKEVAGDMSHGGSKSDSVIRPKVLKKAVHNESDVVKEFTYEYIDNSNSKSSEPKWIRNKFRTVEDLRMPLLETGIQPSSSVNDSDEMKELCSDSDAVNSQSLEENTHFGSIRENTMEKITYFGPTSKKELVSSGKQSEVISSQNSEISAISDAATKLEEINSANNKEPLPRSQLFENTKILTQTKRLEIGFNPNDPFTESVLSGSSLEKKHMCSLRLNQTKSATNHNSLHGIKEGDYWDKREKFYPQTLNRALDFRENFKTLAGTTCHESPDKERKETVPCNIKDICLVDRKIRSLSNFDIGESSYKRDSSIDASENKKIENEDFIKKKISVDSVVFSQEAGFQCAEIACNENDFVGPNDDNETSLRTLSSGYDSMTKSPGINEEFKGDSEIRPTGISPRIVNFNDVQKREAFCFDSKETQPEGSCSNKNFRYKTLGINEEPQGNNEVRSTAVLRRNVECKDERKHESFCFNEKEVQSEGTFLNEDFRYKCAEINEESKGDSDVGMTVISPRTVDFDDGQKCESFRIDEKEIQLESTSSSNTFCYALSSTKPVILGPVIADDNRNEYNKHASMSSLYHDRPTSPILDEQNKALAHPTEDKGVLEFKGKKSSEPGKLIHDPSSGKIGNELIASKDKGIAHESAEIKCALRKSIKDDNYLAKHGSLPRHIKSDGCKSTKTDGCKSKSDDESLELVRKSPLKSVLNSPIWRQLKSDETSESMKEFVKAQYLRNFEKRKGFDEVNAISESEQEKAISTRDGSDVLLRSGLIRALPNPRCTYTDDLGNENSPPSTLTAEGIVNVTYRDSPSNFVSEKNMPDISEFQETLKKEKSSTPLPLGNPTDLAYPYRTLEFENKVADFETNTQTCLSTDYLNMSENLYMSMTPARGSVISIQDRQSSDEIYVEMSDDSGKQKPIAKNEFVPENSHYDFLYKSTTSYEPVYMELPIKGLRPSELKGSEDPSVEDKSSINPRFSLSDTFRPASYYLGSSVRKSGEKGESDSDSDIASPPPIPSVSHVRSHSLDQTPREVSDRRKPLTVVTSLQDLLKDVSEDDLLVEMVNTAKPETAWQCRKSFPNKISPSHQRQGSASTLVPLYENIDTIQNVEHVWSPSLSQQSHTSHQRSYSNTSIGSSMSSGRDPGVPYYYSDIMKEESCGSTSSLRTLPPESLALAAGLLRGSKTTGIDQRNIYESRGRRARTPDSYIESTNRVSNRLSHSLERLIDEDVASVSHPRHGSEPWDEDSTWRANLRRASVRHAKTAQQKPPTGISRSLNATPIQRTICRRKRLPPIGRDAPEEERSAPIGASPESRMTPLGRDCINRPDLSVDRRRRGQIEGYVWDEREEKFLASSAASLDREKLRQWDMMSSASLNWNEVPPIRLRREPVASLGTLQSK
ncbi:uncharacterized protein LOC136038487 isoform X2 [Artemia franciscana]